jgi:hypothetical protein
MIDCAKESPLVALKTLDHVFDRIDQQLQAKRIKEMTAPYVSKGILSQIAEVSDF